MARVRRIYDTPQAWKVETDGGVLIGIIPKNQIKGISPVRGEGIKVTYGEGCGCGGSCHELYFTWEDIINPETENLAELYAVLITMLGVTGGATQFMQEQIRDKLTEINTTLLSGGGGGGGSINTDDLEALVSQTNVLIDALQDTLISENLAKEVTLGQIKTLMESVSGATDGLETLITQTNTFVDGIKVAFNSLIPANHTEIKNLLSDSKFFLQDILNMQESLESAISTGNGILNANGVLLNTILTRLTELKDSYEANFTSFLTTYNATTDALQTTLNNILTQLSASDDHIQEVKTAVDGIIPVLDVIIEALEDLVVIKQKVTDISLVHALSQPSRTDESEADTVYKGYTVTPAAEDGNPVWAISKETTLSGVTSVMWVLGTKDFIYVWNLRATYTYI